MDLNAKRNRVLLAVAGLCALAFVVWTLVRPVDRPTATVPDTSPPGTSVPPRAKAPKPRAQRR